MALAAVGIDKLARMVAVVIEPWGLASVLVARRAVPFVGAALVEILALVAPAVLAQLV